MTIDIAPLYEPTPSNDRNAQVWHALSKDHSVLPATQAIIHEWKESYRRLPSQPKLVFIYRPRRDGRLSWPRHYHHGELFETRCIQYDLPSGWAVWHCLEWGGVEMQQQRGQAVSHVRPPRTQQVSDERRRSRETDSTSNKLDLSVVSVHEALRWAKASESTRWKSPGLVTHRCASHV